MSRENVDDKGTPVSQNNVELSRSSAVKLREWVLGDPAMDHVESSDAATKAVNELLNAIDECYAEMDRKHEEGVEDTPLTGDVVADMPVWVDDGVIQTEVEKDGEVWRETYEFTEREKVADYSEDAPENVTSIEEVED